MKKIIYFIQMAITKIQYLIWINFLPKQKKRYWKNKFKNLKTLEPKKRVEKDIETRNKKVGK